MYDRLNRFGKVSGCTEKRPGQKCEASLLLEAKKSKMKRISKISLSGYISLLSFSLAWAPMASLPVQAQTNRTAPSGTLLLPLTPKLDADTPSAIAPLPQKPARKVATSSSSAAKAILSPVTDTSTPTAEPQKAATPAVPPVEATYSAEVSAASKKLDAGTKETAKTDKADPEEPDIEKIEEANDDMLLKGTVQIVADDTEYDQQKNTFLGTGNAVATIAGQDARLEADMILYDQSTEMLDARGNVKIVRQGTVSTGSSFKFKVSKDEYLITNPDTEVQGTQVIARTGYGNNSGLRFREGTMDLPEPIHMHRNSYYGTISSAQDTFMKDMHPDAYMPDKPSFVFKARKMVYEKYKESGNLTVFGGKLMFGKFGVPVGKLTATVGSESKVTFPVTPFVSNNIMVGGINIGPMFNTALPGDRVFSWAPLIQSGGRTTASSDNNKKGSLGAGFRVSFRGKKLSANLAYGSVSNLLVGDIKYRVNNNTMFQGGINRFIQNGLFGSQRARAIGEFVDTRGIGGVPYLQGISFRSSAGWASDQPSLLNTTPEYKQLFNIQHGNITSGYRLQEQIMTSSQPLFNIGNQKKGATMNLFGGVAGRGYSTGDTMLMGQLGPILNLNLDRLRLQGSVMKSGVKGQSPFVFDQFIQGSKSSQFSGDFKICKWLAVGGNLGYNLDNKMYYQKGISAAIGPDDFKLLVTHDTIRGINRFGFDFMYGSPVPFNKLIMKTSPDRGQLSSN